MNREVEHLERTPAEIVCFALVLLGILAVVGGVILSSVAVVVSGFILAGVGLGYFLYQQV